MYLHFPGLRFKPRARDASVLTTLMASIERGLGKLQPLTPPHEEVGDPDDCKRSLTEAIETQIIPRLLQSHPVHLTQPESLKLGGPIITEERVSALVALSQSQQTQEAKPFIDQLLRDGVSTDRIFLELIAPAARQLGQMWEQDLCDFTEVTRGLICLHEITHRLGFEYQRGPQLSGDVPRIMLASAPGSQHFLGMTIVSDFFRQAGWDVVIEISVSAQELAHAVSNEWFDVIGISCGTEAQLASLPALIRQLKAASGNPQPGILLGGPIFTLQEHDARRLGADGICTDVKAAVTLAASFAQGTAAPD